MRHNKIERLIYLFSKLPGIGSRTARRIVLHLVKQRERLMSPMAEALLDAERSIAECSLCHNLDQGVICGICLNQARDKKILCIVSGIVDLWALENAKFYNGLYYVLGSNLSSQNHQNIENLHLDKLIKRIKDEGINEVIIATNSTMDGQTTALFLTEKLKNLGISITRFAHGIPIGGEFDYLDEMTISTAFNHRKTI